MSQITNKIPIAPDIEEYVLGALLIDERAAIEVMPLLKFSAFFGIPEHKTVFESIQKLYSKSNPIDLGTVSNELRKAGDLEVVGGDAFLIGLTQKISSSAHSEYHCRILQQYWLKRKLVEKANKVLQMAYQEDCDSLELLDRDANLNDEINNLLFDSSKESTYAESLKRVKERIELLSNMKDGEFTGIPTGFAKVNRFTGGWQSEDLIIVAARPGMGKTAFIMKNVVECGLCNIPCGIFSMEMGIDQLTSRTLAINSNFHLAQITRDGFDKTKYFETLNIKTDNMKAFPIHVDDRANLDIRDIISKARIWKRKFGIRILFVDYIQLAIDKTKNNREQEIASISRGLKMLAKELKIPVIALSQLSRNVETRGGDKRPKLSDLRESGSIEQDADIVTFLWRPEYYQLEVPEHLYSQNANAELSFAKYRHGSLATLGLHFDENKAKYSDPEELNNNEPF